MGSYEGQINSQLLSRGQSVAWVSTKTTPDDVKTSTCVSFSLVGEMLTIEIDDRRTTVALPSAAAEAIVDMFATCSRFASAHRDGLLLDRAAAIALAKQLRPEALADEIALTQQAIAEHDELIQQHGDADGLRQVADSLNNSLRMLETAYAALRHAEPQPVTRQDLARAIQEQVTAER